MTREQLVASVLAAQAGREQPVVIIADKNARYQDVLGILDVLQRNGVKKVGLARSAAGQRDGCCACPRTIDHRG